MTSKKESGNTWIDGPGTQFVYADGSTSPPPILREILEYNYLSTWVRAIGLTLATLSIFMAIASGVFVAFMRNDQMIKASQPLFLALLCIGSVTLTLAIFTLSFDENNGWTDSQLDAACVTTPWLFFIGYIVIYSALFVKVHLVRAPSRQVSYDPASSYSLSLSSDVES